MPKHPSPGLVSQAEYARHRKVNRSYISRLAKAGVLVIRHGKVDVAASDAVLDDRPVRSNRARPLRTTRRRRYRSLSGPGATGRNGVPRQVASARL